VVADCKQPCPHFDNDGADDDDEDDDDDDDDGDNDQLRSINPNSSRELQGNYVRFDFFAWIELFRQKHCFKNGRRAQIRQ